MRRAAAGCSASASLKKWLNSLVSFAPVSKDGMKRAFRLASLATDQLRPPRICSSDSINFKTTKFF